MTLLMTERPQRSARKAKGDGHQRRAEILEAAQRVFVEQGYEGATIRRIADEVGLSSTALYMHFRDKGDLLVEICSAQFAALEAINEALLARELDPVLRVRRMLEGYIAFAFAHPNIYRLVFTPPPGGRTPEQEQTLQGLGRRTYALFREGVDRVADAGRLKGPGVDVAAQTAWAASHGIVSLVLTRPAFNWADRDLLVETMLDVVFAGLARA